jgi:hypothetical protein
MVVIVFASVLIAAFQYENRSCPMHGYEGPDDVEPFSLLFAKALAGPGFFPFLQIHSLWKQHQGIVLYFGWVPATFIFWFLMGLLLEFKLRHPGDLLIAQNWIRRSLFAPLLCFGLLMVFSQEQWLRSQGTLPSKEFARRIHELGWCAPGLSTYVNMIWILTGIIYFSAKLWGTFKSRQRLTTND